MKKIIKRTMIIALSLIIVLSIFIFAFINQPKFGKTPSGTRLEKIKNSPNYIDGAFHNRQPTPIMVEGVSYFSAFKKFLFNRNEMLKPLSSIPTLKTDLLNLDHKKNMLVWFGHSSYFIQIDGKKILVDPVLSGAVSPVPFTTMAFKGTDPYTVDDIPEIDYLFITHDHWDHLDYKTIIKLKNKIKKIICGLGVGEHFEYWGFDTNRIIERDWNEQITLDNSFTVYTEPARHFSGRSFKRNTSLWTAFVLQTPLKKLYFGGDGGYDTHFAEIGKTFGEFDLAILENGQYNTNWKYIHSAPEEVLQEAKDLHAKRLLPVHSSKFVLSIHPWDEPLKRISDLCKDTDIHLLTPMIGEEVNLDESKQEFKQWWKNVK
jgi:L-ascorbate metabolism protein UlaG (beta-lactamase superfamily)